MLILPMRFFMQQNDFHLVLKRYRQGQATNVSRTDIICAAINATYTLKENQIAIEGAGCSNQ